jgi:hypothetical protein
MTDRTTPLYVVCSPCRGVGKTLVSRLLTEFYILDNRAVAAYDLADEGPQLADYLPQFTTIADIGDIFGQMAFFEKLIAEHGRASIIDLSHRTFEKFFTVVQEIGFFEEARCRSIEPLILFIIDSDPKSLEAYGSLRRRSTEASLLSIRNRIEPTAISDCDAFLDASTHPASLEIPLLSFSLRALIDRQAFSFCEFWRAMPADLPEALDDELRDWVEGIFFQFRKLELVLRGVDAPMQNAALASSRPRSTHRSHPFPIPSRWDREGGERQRGALPLSDDSRRDPGRAAINERAIGLPYEVLAFAPKKVRGDGASTDHLGAATVEVLQRAGQELRAAENRISQLETEIECVHNRAVRAESSLELVQIEIEEKLVKPATTVRSKIDDLESWLSSWPNGDPGEAR